MQWLSVAAGGLTALALLWGGSAAPEESAPPPAVEPQVVAPWDPVLYIEEQFPRLPYGTRAELVIEDLPPLQPGDAKQPSAWVAKNEPTIIRLDQTWVESIPRSDARRLQATVVHELTHSAVFQSGAPIPDNLLLDVTDTAWAAGALAVSDDPQYQALEAVGACIEQAGLPPHLPASYLSGPCPGEYRDAAFAYLESITGEDWRPREPREPQL